jgi:hypothetical protein
MAMKRFANQENTLLRYVKTDFEERLLRAAFKSLHDLENDLSFNNFAYSIRELSRHILARLSPDKNVNGATWYSSEIPDKPKGVTRAQRIKYAVQGGVTDEFIEDVLDLDIKPHIKRIIKAIDLLSKYTHIEDSTLGISLKKIYELVNATVEAFQVLFDTIELCKSRIIRRIEREIDDSLLNHSIENTFDEIDMLSTHSSVEYCLISEIRITQITESHIFLSVYGSINVRLQYGSNYDVKEGDGAVMHDSFPFTCEMIGDVNQLENFEPDIDSMNVDTSSFYE